MSRMYVARVGLNGKEFPMGYADYSCIIKAENQWKATQKAVEFGQNDSYFSGGEVTYCECKEVTSASKLDNLTSGVYVIP